MNPMVLGPVLVSVKHDHSPTHSLVTVSHPKFAGDEGPEIVTGLAAKYGVEVLNMRNQGTDLVFEASHTGATSGAQAEFLGQLWDTARGA
jgi:hypothetical protein